MRQLIAAVLRAVGESPVPTSILLTSSRHEYAVAMVRKSIARGESRFGALMALPS
ncbi:MAG: hypothetical protein ABIO78_03925 [Thermoanaerobaculia bacterium]